jgi:hypothetical protein
VEVVRSLVLGNRTLRASSSRNDNGTMTTRRDSAEQVAFAVGARSSSKATRQDPRRASRLGLSWPLLTRTSQLIGIKINSGEAG